MTRGRIHSSLGGLAQACAAYALLAAATLMAFATGVLFMTAIAIATLGLFVFPGAGGLPLARRRAEQARRI